MDDFSVFFSTTAQVSAIFMGFALLVPAIKALSSGLLTLGIIKPDVMVKKFFFFISFPLFVLANPLIVSITILQNSSLPTVVKWFVVISALFFLFWLRWLQRNSKIPKQWIVNIMLDIVPWVFLIIHIGYVLLFLLCPDNAKHMASEIFGLLWLQSLWQFLTWDTLLLVLSGFVLILRNLMISSEEGILFENEDVDDAFYRRANEFTKKIKDAVSDRKKIVNYIELIIKYGSVDDKEKEQLKIHNGGHNAEIQDIIRVRDELQFRCNKIRNKEKMTLRDFLDFESRKKSYDKYVEDFMRGTTRAQMVKEELWESR